MTVSQFALDEPSTDSPIRRRWPLTESEQQARLTHIKDLGDELCTLLSEAVSDEEARCYRHARVKVEEAVLWAVKGVMS